MCTKSIFCSLFPDYDENCDCINSAPIQVSPNDTTIDEFLEKDVPHIIHQIWLGDKSKIPSKTRKWERYIEDGWTYRLWTENDEKIIKKFMDKRNFGLWKTFLSTRNWWAASDILRYEIIREFGGIYIDCDFVVPENAYGNIPLENIFSMRGATFVTEQQGRNIGSDNALFLMNGILCASPNHPIFEYLCKNIYGNVVCWINRKGNYNAMYCTGPFFLNKCLNGPFHLLPIQYIKPIMID